MTDKKGPPPLPTGEKDYSGYSQFGVGQKIQVTKTNEDKPIGVVSAVIARPWMIWPNPQFRVPMLQVWSKALSIKPEQLENEFVYMIFFETPKHPFAKAEAIKAMKEEGKTDYEINETLDMAKTNLMVCSGRDLESVQDIIPDTLPNDLYSI